MNEKMFRELVFENSSKLLLVVLDGMGGLADSKGLTELESASTPNMDALAKLNEIGLMNPVEIGITPGSGPGHLGLFGYEPTDFPIGRGILEALGLGIHVDKTTVLARCNFATISADNKVADRRAGRISDEENKRLCRKLNSSVGEIDGINAEFVTGKEHRFVLVLRGVDSGGNVRDTDPQIEGVEPLSAAAEDDTSALTADIINKLYLKTREILKDEERANGILFRGISKMPEMETMKDKYSLKCACIATYPMYKGLAKLVGMDIVDAGETIEDEISALKKHYSEYDYFFMHIKKTDSYGEDGNFGKKVGVIEHFDSLLPEILKLNFDVVSITADHSTPSVLKAHSYHPVPLMMIHKYPRRNIVEGFGETECIKGSIGTIYSKQMINLMLAASGRLKKYGA